MSVFKRKTTSGQTREYHYKFMQGGRTYWGVCEGCEDEAAAKAYEANVKKLAKGMTSQRNVKAMMENYRDELAGGETISLDEAFDLAWRKPRKRRAGKKLVADKKAKFADFAAFMKDRHHSKDLKEVSRRHATEYLAMLATTGKHRKKIKFKNHLKNGRESSYDFKEGPLAPSTVNYYHRTISEVFNALAEDAGLAENPFARVPLMMEAKVAREAFTEEEFKKIMKNADDFVKPIFAIGFFTALREGDICTLKWSEVDLNAGFIFRRQRKTGNLVEIPIMKPLLAYLQDLKDKSDGKSEYALPTHREMYESNPTGVTYRVKTFLASLEIETTRKITGRVREVSVKDVHSLRHSFCYYAGISGIPLPIVQSIVGHMTEEMTRLYSAHATRKAKREKMSLMPDLLGLGSESDLH